MGLSVFVHKQTTKNGVIGICSQTNNFVEIFTARKLLDFNKSQSLQRTTGFSCAQSSESKQEFEGWFGYKLVHQFTKEMD